MAMIPQSSTASDRPGAHPRRRSRLAGMVTAAVSNNDTAERQVDRWNANNDVSCPVSVRINGGKSLKTRTSGPAWIRDGVAYITCRGLARAVPLSTVTKRYQAYIRIKRRGQTPHWLPTCWDTEAECLAAVRETAAADPRVESYEIRTDRPSDA